MARTFFEDLDLNGVPITVEYTYHSDEGAAIVAAWTNQPGWPALDVLLSVEDQERFEAKLTEEFDVNDLAFDDGP